MVIDELTCAARRLSSSPAPVPTDEGRCESSPLLAQVTGPGTAGATDTVVPTTPKRRGT